MPVDKARELRGRAACGPLIKNPWTGRAGDEAEKTDLFVEKNGQGNGKKQRLRPMQR